MTHRVFVGLILISLLAGSAVAQAPGDYTRSTKGTRILEGQNGFAIRVLVEQMNLGGVEVDVGEITFPYREQPPTRAHRHQAVEIFYILSGEMEHIVNGESFVLTPGMVGIVRPGDEVIHKINSPEGVRSLVIWVPGGEAERLAQFFTSRPID